jgi:hypothetical protein
MSVKKVVIKINCVNDAFVINRPEDEIRKILKEEYDCLEYNNISDKKLFDSNGNPIGYIIVEN